MTQPEQQEPENLPTPPQPDVLERDFEAIALDELDKENRGWVVNYVNQLKERLTEEQAADQPDFVMISYLKREIATYEDLLARTEKKK